MTLPNIMKLKYVYNFIVLALLAYIAILAWSLLDARENIKCEVCNKPQVDQSALLTLVQEWKFNNSGYRYKTNYYLCGLAEERAKEATFDWDHQGFTDKIEQIYRETHFESIGENLSRDGVDEFNTLDNWLNSPSHKATLVDNYTYTCIRCVANVCAQEFAK